MWEPFDAYFQGWQERSFWRRKRVEVIANKVPSGALQGRINRGRYVGAGTDARSVLNNRTVVSLPPTGRGNGNSRRVPSAARLICLHVKRIKSVGSTEVEHSQIASSLHHLGIVLQDKGDLDGAESQYRASLCMKRRIHGEDADHPDIAVSLHELGRYCNRKKASRVA